MADKTSITLPYNWFPRQYQLPFWRFMERGGKRACLVWHRRAGKDDTGINWCATAAFRRVGLYWHMLPTYKQGRQIVWNGRRSDGTPFLGAFPEQVIKRKRDDEMMIEFMNGSIYQVVGTDDVDRLVGTNPVGVILSEYSLHDPAAWDYIRPILAENGGWAVFIYTARGRNHGYELFKMAQGHPEWFAQLLTVEDTYREDGVTPVVSAAAIQSERDAGMAPEIIQQEFWCSFDAALVGAYYKQQIATAKAANRIGKPCPVDPLLPVDTIWDLGIDDATAIYFVQRAFGEIRVVHYLEAEGEGIAYYVEELRKWAAREGATFGEHWAPHDIEVRELGTGLSRRQTAQKLGIRFNVVPKWSIADGINAVRTIFPRLRFHNSKEVEAAIDLLSQYQKEFDDRRQIYKDRPLHDFTSHAADALRYLAVAYRTTKPVKPRQEKALAGGSPFEEHEASSQEYVEEGDVYD